MQSHSFQLHLDRVQRRRRAYNIGVSNLTAILSEQSISPSIIHCAIIRVNMAGKRAVGQELAADDCILTNLIGHASLEMEVSVSFMRHVTFGLQCHRWTNTSCPTRPGHWPLGKPLGFGDKIYESVSHFPPGAPTGWFVSYRRMPILLIN